MTVTSGFFNSINGDRKYDALQVAELFDGLILDGVYETIYNQFRVSPNNEYTIQVDTGRAWFKHTWIKNDNIKPLNLELPNPSYDRIDAVIIEVDHRDYGRVDDIKIITGTPSISPQRPTLIQTDELYQVPLAYITVRYTSLEITAADIVNMVGTSACPFVTGVISVMNIDMLVSQWMAQWDKLVKQHESDFDTWFKDFNDRLIQYEYDFREWFAKIKETLDEDTAASLLLRIIDLEEKMQLLLNKGMLLTTIDDSNDDPILDSYNFEVNGSVSILIPGDGECSCGGNESSSIPNKYIDSLFK